MLQFPYNVPINGQGCSQEVLHEKAVTVALMLLDAYTIDVTVTVYKAERSCI